jgi:hypothetical protein
MSPAMSALSSVGLTHQILILCVLGLVAAGVIGLFWHYILPGAIIILVASLFYVAPDATTSTESQVKKPDNSQVESFDEYQAYMKDCMEVAEYSMLECKRLWNERSEKHAEKEVDFKPADDVKLVDVDNEEYKARRAATIQKGNVVVMQATYH